MKRLLVSAAVLGLLTSAPAFAQTTQVSAPATTSADAIVVAPISVSNNGTTLNFGKIAASSAPGTVAIDSAGTLTSSAPNLHVAGSTGSVPTFTVTGAASLAYTANIPATATLLLTPGGGASMSANLSKSGGAASLSAGGTDTFKVVGTLNVLANQTPGTYHGTFDVTVQYN
jgi:spore coat protein U-like protein